MHMNKCNVFFKIFTFQHLVWALGTMKQLRLGLRVKNWEIEAKRLMSSFKISKFSFQRLVQKIVLDNQKAMELTSVS